MRTALFIVDVQNDFARPDGALAVKDGDRVVDTINDLRAKGQFDLVVLTQDWHPPGHVSFYSSHSKDSKAKLFSTIDLGEGNIQMLWPDHCVQGSSGAEFHPKLIMTPLDKIVRKGMDTNVDSYSGFMDNSRDHKTDLEAILKENMIDRIVVTGLAFDYCVGSTAMDGKDAGFDVIVCTNASKSVAPDSEGKMKERLKAKGIKLMTTLQYLDSIRMK